MATSETAERTRPERLEPKRSARRAHALIALALALATLAAYAQVRHHAFLTYDDPDYIAQNPNLHLDFGWESVRSAFRESYLGNWAPLTLLSLRLDYEFYGLDPAGYLLTNVALHVLASLALYAAFARMTGARGRSAFVAAVFALHPLHVESVAWVSERKDVLSGLFFMLALWAHALHAERPRIARLLLVTLCLLLGLLSKATLVTLPAVLLLLDWWPLGRIGTASSTPPGVRVTLRRALLEKLPMLVLVAAVASVTWIAQHEAGYLSPFERLSLGARVRNALEAYVLYAAKSFWPSDLAVFYPHALGVSPVWPSVAAGLLLAGVSAGVARMGRTRPYLAVGWLWYLGTLVPTIGLVQVGLQARADRYMYLPLIGLSICVAWGACDLLDRLRARRLARPAAAAALAALWVCTWLQVRHWRDSFTLFEHALAVTAENSVAHLQLGSAYLEAGDADAAERHFAQAAAIQPGWTPARLGLADVRALRGDLAGAIAAYERELKSNPNDPLAAGRYGFALVRAGRVAEAQGPLEMAIAAYPGSAPLHVALAVVSGQLGRTQDAIRSNRQALRLDPGQIEAANNLAWLLATRAEASIQERQESILLAERASRARGSEDPSLLDTLAAAYAAVGRFEEAAAAAARAAASAEAQGQPQLAREIRKHRELYAARRAYVEPSPRTPTGAEGARASADADERASRPTRESADAQRGEAERSLRTSRPTRESADAQRGEAERSPRTSRPTRESADAQRGEAERSPRASP